MIPHDLIGSSWRRRTDGWVSSVEYSTDRGAGVHLVAKVGEGGHAVGLHCPTAILVKAFDRVHWRGCHRCHDHVWRFDGPGRRYVRHDCAERRRAYLLAERGRFRERCKAAVRLGWAYHPLAKVLRRRARKLIVVRQTAGVRPVSALGWVSLQTSQLLVGAIYAMNANGVPHATIASETGLRGADVELVLAWADAVARRRADQNFRRRRR